MAEERSWISIRQAAFIGVGAMVGAGIFALLGTAGEVAGAAVWISFLIAGAIAGLQGYSFAKLGARFPSAGGFMEYVRRGFGEGHMTGTMGWLVFASNIIVTGLVAVSFGSYARSLFLGDDAASYWIKVFAVVLLLGMAWLNVVGSKAVARVQSMIVWIVVGILLVFSVTTIANMDPSLLSPAGYPDMRSIISSVALTFFAFLGFGVISFTAKDLRDPSKQLPKAMYLALGIATTVYVLVALGVFGTLTVDQVIASGSTAIAVAAKPTLGELGFWLMSVTGLFATAGATNSGIYPAAGLSAQLADEGQFPPSMGRSVGRISVGMLIMVVLTIVLAIGFDLNAIANIGSAVALFLFSIVTIGHLRVHSTTGANLGMLILGLVATVGTLAVFVTTTLAEDRASTVALILVVVLSIVLDAAWKWMRNHREQTSPTAPPLAKAEVVG